jgi:hypothetical protein
MFAIPLGLFKIGMGVFFPSGGSMCIPIQVVGKEKNKSISKDYYF